MGENERIRGICGSSGTCGCCGGSGRGGCVAEEDGLADCACGEAGVAMSGGGEGNSGISSHSWGVYTCIPVVSGDIVVEGDMPVSTSTLETRCASELPNT